MKIMRKKLAALMLGAALAAGSVTGCSGNTKIVFTTGLAGNQLFKIGSSTCALPEAMVYLTTFFNQYDDVYGSEIWKHDFGDITLEDYVKDVVISRLTQIKVMNLMAKEQGITLTSEEEQRASKAAAAYYELLDEEMRKSLDITPEVAQTVYREYMLAGKVYDTITESVEMEISDDEARTVTVQTIYLSCDTEDSTEKEKIAALAGELKERLDQGADFETLAVQYSEAPQITSSYGRGEKAVDLEEAVFSLDQDEVSDVIETEDGYYLVKCLETFDAEATEANKLVLAEQKKKEAFSNMYEEIVRETPSQFRDKTWDKVTVDEEKDQTTANFFRIYEEYSSVQ